LLGRQPKRAKVCGRKKCEKKSNVRKKRNGQTLVARWIKLSSSSRHVEDVAFTLQMRACVLISATAAVDFGVSGLSICENAKLANETPNGPKISASDQSECRILKQVIR
jgi:hypothetical protein